MEYIADGKRFQFYHDLSLNDRLRNSFNALSFNTFELSFEAWYQDGYWTDRYRPHMLLDGERVAANASVNVLDTTWQGQARRYIQLGTVMTDPAYRKMGLSRFLIEHILEEWRDKCDAVYLYANDSVLDFYPKFGFIRAEEYQAVLRCKPCNVKVRKLDMTVKSDVDILRKYYECGNPFAELPLLNNWGLLMFYCAAPMSDCVYYIEEYSCVVIAQKDGNTLFLHDIYGGQHHSLEDILGAVTPAAETPVHMGFSLSELPPEAELIHLKEEDSTLFVLQGKENVFVDHKVMFPVLSHA